MSRLTAIFDTSVALAVCLFIVAAPSSADDLDRASGLHALTDTWMIARGGRLYDNWVAELEADTPKASHPAYPARGRMKGPATWRCKECHGWDYRGSTGDYGRGPHYTGIKGVRGVIGMKPEKIQRIVMNDAHGFTTKDIPPEPLKHLALFLSRGQTDSDRHIDRKTKAARGNARRGAPMFQTICGVCHGLNGKEINFTDEGPPEYLGTVCSENPWEALHKMRSGQPGFNMISLTSLKTDQQIDVLTYCQTLPTK